MTRAEKEERLTRIQEQTLTDQLFWGKAIAPIFITFLL